MFRAVRLVIVALAVAGLLALPAGAQETAASTCVDSLTNSLVLTEQATWIHQAQTKAGNLGAFGATAYPSWNTTKPAASVTTGAGGGYLGNSASFLEPSVKEQTGLTMQGAFSGCLDTMLFDLYVIRPTNRTGTSGSLAENPLTAMVTLTIDGKEITSGLEVQTKQIVNPNGQATYLSRFAMTNLHAALVDFGVDPAAEHTIKITVAPRYINTDNTIFVYDTSEVPSGITFNGVPNENYAILPAF